MKSLNATELLAILEPNTPGVCLIDFWATWCGPCKMILPTLEMLEQSFPTVAFYKADVEEVRSVVMRYAITNVPTIFILKDGVLVKRITGVVSKQQLTEILKDSLR